MVLLITTLIPTFLHIVAVVFSGALCRLGAFGRQDTLNILTSSKPSSRDLDDISDVLALRRVAAFAIVIVAAALVAEVCLVVARPHGGTLAEIAKAVSRVSKGISADTTQARVEWIKSLELHELGLHEQALRSIAKAIALDPTDPRNYSLKGAILHETRKYSDALEPKRIMVELSPSNPRLHSSLGDTLKNIGALKDALE